MAVVVVSGASFSGVDFGTAPGDAYVIGATPVSELLRVDEAEYAAALIGAKYYHHPAGDPGGANRQPDALVRMTMLVSPGRWRQKLWSEESGHSVEVLLQAPGDFIAWVPGLWHSWHPELESTMLTISFKRKSAAPAATPDRGGITAS
jgi:hypothetical protein